VFRPALIVTALYEVLAVLALMVFLPMDSLKPRTPAGRYPVREVDILSRAQVTGNLATPFSRGSYCSWRLYPRIKVSMDGRYETTYPESTSELNFDFHDKLGTNWDRLIRDFPVDFVILDLVNMPLRPEDLTSRGYAEIRRSDDCTALLALPKYADQLRRAAAELPSTTVDPFDAKIPETWWTH
jgi:hypothetical protein